MERLGKKVIQEVPMVESQAANLIKRKVNLPAAVFSRSPAREAESSKFIMQTSRWRRTSRTSAGP